MQFYDFNIQNGKGESVPLSNYKGKVVLVVNTATHCGFTPQYEAIEALYEAYHKQGLEVIDLPCNQFLNQAPEKDSEIQSFCKMRYNTQFETFKKIEVNGKNAHPLYGFLKREKPLDYPKKKAILPLFKGAIKWNFTKFLINRDGEVIYRFGPSFKPEDLKPFIEGALQ